MLATLSGAFLKVNLGNKDLSKYTGTRLNNKICEIPQCDA